MEDQAINQSSSSNNASEKTPESILELNIKTIDSLTYTFKVNKNETVSLFKEKIANELGVPVGQQRLIFRARLLKDDHPLSEYHLENGHTLHLVVRQPAESVQSSGTPSEGGTANDGNVPNGGPSQNRGHISHSVVFGTMNVGDQTDGIAPDLSQVIGAGLNSFGVGGQQSTNNSTNGTQSSVPSDFSGQAPPGNTAPGVGGQNQAASHSQAFPGVSFQAASHSQAFPGASFQASIPRVVQIPVTAATAIPIPSFQTPIPDSLDTLSEFINRMEQALSQNGYQPDASLPTSGGLPREELPRTRRGLPTSEALSVVLRNAQHLLSGRAVSSLSHIAGGLEQDGSSSDPTRRAQIQTEAVQVGLAMQHLGALLLELGRTMLTLRMGQSPELSYVNAGPAVYISPSGPNPIMVQPFPHQTSSLFTGAATSANPLTGTVGLGAVPRHINIHIHAGTSPSPIMSSIGNQQSNGDGRQGDLGSNTSSVRVLPVRNIIAAAVPAPSTGEITAAGAQPGLDGSISVSQLNARIRELVNNMQGRNQIPSGTETLARDTSMGQGASSATLEQPTNNANICAPVSSSGSPNDFNPRSQSDKEVGEDIGHAARGKDISSSIGESSAPFGESTSTEKDATSDAKTANKPTPDAATATPLGLGLGVLDHKKRNKQPKALGKNEDSGTSATVESVQQSSGVNGQQLLQSLFSGISHSDETGLRGGQGSDDRVDVSSAMSQVLESPVLDGLLAGVSQQAGVGSPNMLRDMLQEFTQNPQIMNTVQQIAQQVDGQEIENMMSGGGQGEGGGFDFSRMVQQMPLVSRAFSQGGPSAEPATQQPFQVNVQSMAQMIEQSDPPSDVFRAMVENAAMSQDDLVNALCCDEVLSQEYAELLRRDIEGRLKDDQSP